MRWLIFYIYDNDPKIASLFIIHVFKYHKLIEINESNDVKYYLSNYLP